MMPSQATERFGVVTVTGFLTMRSDHGKGPPGVSAHVCDRLNASRVVATFRSEDFIGQRRKYSCYATVVAAQLHAEKLHRAELDDESG